MRLARNVERPNRGCQATAQTPLANCSTVYTPAMPGSSIIPRSAVIVSAALLLLFLLIAAAGNVPWALTFMRSRTTLSKVSTVRKDPNEMPDQWPIKTPHVVAWPRPASWTEGYVFGCRIYDVRSEPPMSDRNGFTLSLQHLGWPLPVIEVKQMWWDWNDPTLNGPGAPESDPAPSLITSGLILNPLFIGGGAWAVLVMPWLIGIIVMRARRWRANRCLECGYPVGTSPSCTECGHIVRPRPA